MRIPSFLLVIIEINGDELVCDRFYVDFFLPIYLSTSFSPIHWLLKSLRVKVTPPLNLEFALRKSVAHNCMSTLRQGIYRKKGPI